MPRTQQAIFNARCIVRAARSGRIDRVAFHLRGFLRAVGLMRDER